MSAAARLDLRDSSCPITWVKTRIALERLALGEVLEVWLGEGEPAASVPRTAEEEGHQLVALEPLAAGPGAAIRLLVRKGAPPPALP
ncbi:MAG: sulfurtransferase TusA family protein [Anaeromyxobacter sp.]|nr:sulfurtransferase TusA family protein [Anaeromyxobacter sp.]